MYGYECVSKPVHLHIFHILFKFTMLAAVGVNESCGLRYELDKCKDCIVTI